MPVVTIVMFCLSGIFKKWRQQKRKVDTENEKAFRAKAILTRNFKARVLQVWRVVNQEQQIISPMVARRERKEMARYTKYVLLVLLFKGASSQLAHLEKLSLNVSSSSFVIRVDLLHQ